MRGKLRLFTDNYIDVDRLASYTVSSEKTSFPVENAFNSQRRSKVWKSDGYFNIDSTNDTLIIRESVGVDLTVTLANGEYTSTTAFMSALAVALDAAGASTYTVTQNSYFKFVITSNGLGGGGIFQIMTTNVLSTLAPVLGYDILANKTGALTYTADVLKISSPGEFILFDMGIASFPDAFIMTGPRNSALPLSPSGTFKLQASYTNNFAAPVYNETLVYDDEVIVKFADGDDTLDVNGYRYWRVVFEDQNPNGCVSIGSFFLGKFFAPERGRAQYPFKTEYIDRTQTIFSEGGQSYADVFQQSQGYSIEWFGLEKEDIDSITEIFRDYGTGYPFFVSFDSGEAFSTSVNRFVKLVKFSGEPNIELVSPNNFRCTMQFREEL